MNQYKAIFFDVDGTIYSHRIHDIPASTKDALVALKEKGYLIGISTSRCRYEMKHLPAFFRTFPFDSQFYDGGALVMANNKVIDKHPIACDIVTAFVKLCEKEGIPLRYSTIDCDYFAFPCDWRIHDEFFQLYLSMPKVKAYEQEEVYNMLAYPQKAEHKEMILAFQDQMHIIEHGSKTIELTAHGINKSEGIKAMMHHWQIAASECVCFGDGYNDIQMLALAGLGVAMGNAKDDVKEAADYVCGDIEEDGVYECCKAFGLL